MTTAIGAYVTASNLKAYIGKTDSGDDTLLGLICDRVNQFIETTTGRVLAPISSATYLYDGDGSRQLYLPQPADKAPVGGFRAVTLVEVAGVTGGTYITLNATDYFLRGGIGMTGPFEWLIGSDIPTSGFGHWPRGYSTVRVTGTAGWAAIPDDITELAIDVAARVWNRREVGVQDVDGKDEQGIPIVARYFSGRDKNTLHRYALEDVVTGG